MQRFFGSVVTTLTLSLLAVCGTGLAAPLSPMRVLVTNDDGVGAPGIDALVQRLATNPNLDITVVAPAVNQSGAGDAFNAGYLAARLKGASIEHAARSGHALAGWTIMRSGAIPPRDS